VTAARRARIVAVAAAAACGWVVALAAPRNFPTGIFGDDAQYAVLAKSLRVEGSYRLLFIPGQPAETLYPPGFPALLAAAWSPSRSDASNLDRLRWVNLALAGPLAGVIALAGLEVFGLGASVSVALAVGGVLAPAVMAFWTLPLSEPLFLILVLVALSLQARGRGTAGLVLLVLAAYVRTIALAFLAGALLVEWRRGGKRRAAAQAAIAVAGCAPWLLWAAVQARGAPPSLYGVTGTYSQWYLASLVSDPLTVLFRVPVRNVWLLLVSVGDAVTGFLPVGAVAAAVIGAAVAWGVWRARRVAAVALAGLGCYVIVVLLWPYPPYRFVGAVWPLALLAVAAGVRGLGARAAWAVAAGSLAFGVVGFARGAGVGQGKRGQGSAALLAAVRPLLPADAVLASSDPAFYYLKLGVRGVPNDRMRSYRYYRLGYWSTAWGLGDDLWAIVRRYHPTHLLVDNRGINGRYAAGSLMRQCPGVLRELWSTPGLSGEYLFAVRSDVSCAPVIAKP
jgi:hypothetical protein